MSRRISRRLLLTAVLVLLALAAGGTASAFWSGAGDGGGSGATGTTPEAVTLGPGTPAAELYPGGQADVELSVSNPNGFDVHIGSLALDTGQGTYGFAVDEDHSGCDVAALDFSTQTNSGDGWTVPRRVGLVSGTLAIVLTNALSMGEDAADACQGATTTVYLVAGQ